MKTKILKTSTSLLIVAICAILFCGLFAINSLSSKKAPTAYAYEAGSSATLRAIGSANYNDINKKAWWVGLEYTVNSLTITNDNNKISGTPVQTYSVEDATSENPLTLYVFENNGAYDAVIHADVETIYAPENSMCLFYSTSKMASNFEINFQNFDTSKVTDMSRMFSASQYMHLNVSGFDTSSVQYAAQMFNGCNNLKSIDFSSKILKNGKKSWDLSSLKAGSGALIEACGNLENLDLRSFNVSNLSETFSVFYYMSGNNALKSIDMSTWVIPEGINVTFYNIPSVEIIKAPKECNGSVELSVAPTLYEQGTENVVTEISSATNGMVLVNQPNYIPVTGFVDEQLLPAVAIGVVSVLAVVVIGTNKKRKFNI